MRPDILFSEPSLHRRVRVDISEARRFVKSHFPALKWRIDDVCRIDVGANTLGRSSLCGSGVQHLAGFVHAKNVGVDSDSRFECRRFSEYAGIVDARQKRMTNGPVRQPEAERAE